MHSLAARGATWDAAARGCVAAAAACAYAAGEHTRNLMLRTHTRVCTHTTDAPTVTERTCTPLQLGAWRLQNLQQRRRARPSQVHTPRRSQEHGAHRRHRQRRRLRRRPCSGGTATASRRAVCVRGAPRHPAVARAAPAARGRTASMSQRGRAHTCPLAGCRLLLRRGMRAGADGRPRSCHRVLAPTCSRPAPCRATPAAARSDPPCLWVQRADRPMPQGARAHTFAAATPRPLAAHTKQVLECRGQTAAVSQGARTRTSANGAPPSGTPAAAETRHARGRRGRTTAKVQGARTRSFAAGAPPSGVSAAAQAHSACI